MKIIEGFISIIVPVFNGELFIDDAYKNILNQKLTDFEIIFIDNNSTDTSLTKIIKIQHLDSRVSFYKETKQGAAVARNRGLANAKGEFIHFYDVDDRLFDGALMALKKVLNHYPNTSSVFGKTVRSNQTIDLACSILQKNEKVHYNKPFLGLDWLKNKSKLSGPPAFLHRRIVFDTLKGFQEDLLIGEDAFFHVRLGNEFNITFLDRNIYHYYRHPNSVVSKQNKKVVDKVFTYWPQTVKAYLPYLKENKISKEFKSEVYKQMFWSIGKMIVLTKKIDKRKLLRTQIGIEISPFKIPVVLNLFIYLIILFGNYNLFKFYFFYVVNPYIKLIYLGKK